MLLNIVDDIIVNILYNLQSYHHINNISLISKKYNKIFNNIINNYNYKLLQQIIDKIIPKWYFTDIQLIQLKLYNFNYIDYFKYIINWDDNDKSHIDFNYDNHNNHNNNHNIVEMFYCDCPLCYRTYPCGRGNINPYNSEEYKLLEHYFKFNWWDYIK